MDKGLRTWMALGMGLTALFLYFSGVFVWLTPLPLIYLYKKGGRGKALLVTGLCILSLAVLAYWVIPNVAAKYGGQKALEIFFWVPGVSGGSVAEPSVSGVFSFWYFVLFAAMGVLLGEWQDKNFGITALMGRTLGLILLALVAVLAWQIKGDWAGFAGSLEDYFIAAMNQVAASAEANEEMKSQWGMLKPHFPQIAYYGVRLLPAVAVNTVLFVLWLNIVVARRFFAKDSFFANLGPLRQWRLSFGGVWLVIASALLFILGTYWLPNEYLRLIAMNSLMVFALIYFFQGLAIVVYYVIRWSLSPMLRMLLYAALLLAFQPVGVLLMAFGFFDSWFDFRKLAPKAAA